MQRTLSVTGEAYRSCGSSDSEDVSAAEVDVRSSLRTRARRAFLVIAILTTVTLAIVCALHVDRSGARFAHGILSAWENHDRGLHKFKVDFGFTTDPNDDFGQVLRQSDTTCKARAWWIGDFSKPGYCAMWASAAGGKFFMHRPILHPWIFWKPAGCWIVYTTSKHCPEGFEYRRGWNFYELKMNEQLGVGDSAGLACNFDLLNTSLKFGATEVLGSALEQSQFRYAELPFVRYTDKRHWFFDRRLCNVEERLLCNAKDLQIVHIEKCCDTHIWDKEDCTPPAYITRAFVQKTLRPDDLGQRYEVSGKHNMEIISPLVMDGEASTEISQNLTGVSFKVVQKRTLRDGINQCPIHLKAVIRNLADFGNWMYFDLWKRIFPNWIRTNPVHLLLGLSMEASALVTGPFDAYTNIMFAIVVLILLRSFDGPYIDPKLFIKLPEHTKYLNRLTIYDFVGTPLYEPDTQFDKFGDPGFFPQSVSFYAGCIFGGIRLLESDDGFADGANVWEPLVTKFCPLGNHTERPKHCTKKAYVLGLFRGYFTSPRESGVAPDPVYPYEQINFRQVFMKADHIWEDSLETYLAFGQYASFRLRALTPQEVVAGAAFVIETNDMAVLTTRPYFGKVGANMFFSADGHPVMIQTPYGKKIWRSTVADKLWQYWKFVWRSSLFLKITVMDHLYTGHFTAALALSAAIRETVPASHPLRRFLTMFTFNTIAVNMQAQMMLQGPEHLLHRSTPFHDMAEVTAAAKAGVPTMQERFGAFVDKPTFDALPYEIQQTPYYQDGLLMFEAELQMVSAWVKLYSDDWCDVNGVIKDAAIIFFLERHETWSMFAKSKDTDYPFLGLRESPDGPWLCEGLKRFLATLIFAVTGWHRTVGYVTDLTADPDLNGFSWREGEPFTRPRQHLQMMIVSASTAAKTLPKIDKDYSFLAEGLPKEEEARSIFTKFQADIFSVQKVIDARNSKRAVPFHGFDPKYVDCSLGV